MQQPRLEDLVRQVAIVFAAILQVYASYSGGDSVGTIAQETRSLILPASFAFAIWGPIFLLCGIYAIYQALPAQRDRPALREIGWWTAAAFLANGVWIYAYTNRNFVVAQVIITIGFVAAVGGFLRLERVILPGATSTVEWRLVAPTLGLLGGWLTAACVVGLAGTLVSLGFSPEGSAAELGAAAQALLGGGIGVVVVAFARNGPSTGWVAYAGALLWALAAIVIEQQSTSTLVAGAAVVSAILVISAAVGPWRVRQENLGRA